MERLCQRPGRSAGVGRVGRAISGWCFLVLAVTVMQGATVWPAVAQPGSATPSGVASDTILAWGANNFGQLGDGSTIDRNAPVAVSLPPDTTVSAVAGGDSHSLALTSAGAVLAWGKTTSANWAPETTSTAPSPSPWRSPRTPRLSPSPLATGTAWR